MSGDLYWRLTVTSSGVTYEASDDLSSMTIDQHEGMPASLEAHMADPFKVLSHAIQEGMDVEAELGTDDDHAVVFRGRIHKVNGSFPAEQTPTIQLNAYDSSMRMGLRKRNRPWADRTLSAIVTAVAAEYFGALDIGVQGDPSFPGNGIRQREETDLAFLQRLATTYGCVMFVTPGDGADTFHFISQYQAMTAAPAVTVYYGRSGVDHRLLSFESNADTSQIELPRVLSGIDYATGKATEIATTAPLPAATAVDDFFSENLTALAAAQPDKAGALAGLIGSAAAAQASLRADLGTAVREATSTFISEEQQAAIAQNQFSTSLLGMRASGTTVGIRQLAAQSTVGIGDVGGRFGGTWFLAQVRHILDAQGYRNEFECRR